jgi:hypothetical protein
MGTLASEIVADLATAKANAAAWIAQLETRAGQGLAQLAKLQESPIVQALEDVALSPAIEADIARWITDAAAEFARLDPPADPAPAPAPPVAPVVPAAPVDGGQAPAPSMAETGPA